MSILEKGWEVHVNEEGALTNAVGPKTVTS